MSAGLHFRGTREARIIDKDELITRYYRLHNAAARLLEVLPANDRLPSAAARAVEQLAAAMLPPQDKTWDADLDPARHCLAAGELETRPDGRRTSRPRTLEEAAGDGRQGIEEGWKVESNIPYERLEFLDPGLTVISTTRALVISNLLEELSARVEPGRIVDGPIQADDSYRRFVAQVSEDLFYRSGGWVGPRSWDHDPHDW